jgi:hypothetical protein
MLGVRFKTTSALQGSAHVRVNRHGLQWRSAEFSTIGEEQGQRHQKQDKGWRAQWVMSEDSGREWTWQRAINNALGAQW